ncbi:MAG: glycoside hydrolase family 76 protein [Bacteroidota bacterium]
MKSIYLTATVLLAGYLLPYNGQAQTAGIKSRAIYILQSKANGKLLNVHNSSIENKARVNCWTDTKSDSQRWRLNHIGQGIYTITNVESGKLLHSATDAADSVNVDQITPTGANDVQWNIVKKEDGTYQLKPLSEITSLLSVYGNASADGAKVNLNNSPVADAASWVFKQDKVQDKPLTTKVAGKVFDAWYTQYKIETGRGFWDKAEMMEIVLDAYEVTRDKKYLDKFNAMYTNFITRNKEDWMYNNFNDDIAWAVLFSVRGYLFTGNKAYLDKAKDQYDKMYARALTNKYGGGLNWFETKTSKNACIQGPAMVAACYLAQATGDKTYYDKAMGLYKWSKVYLFDPATGKVNDNIDLDKQTGEVKTGTWSSTYNQGTYLGAAVMLYKYTKDEQYLADAKKIALYARDAMFNGKTMNNEDGGNDLPGFKGIFARYARKYTLETKNRDLVEWLQLNAKVAYNNRNSQDLIHTKWATKTPELKPRSAFGGSTAVSLLMNTLSL